MNSRDQEQEEKREQGHQRCQLPLVKGDVIQDENGRKVNIISKIAAGTFARVYKAIDEDKSGNQGEYYAVKIPALIQHAQTIIFEANVLEYLKTNCKILYEHNLSYYRNTIITKEFPCICMDLLGPSVYQLLLDKKLEGMPLKTIQNIMKSVLITLDDISSIGVIHMDIRPENILQSANDPNKFIVVDYHCAGLEGRTNPVYVQSRFYRAPEVLLRLEYGCKIDIWSLGVAAFEMMVGVPLFPGNTEVQMLYIINSMVGPFPKNMIDKSSRRLSFFLHDGSMKPAERLAEENMENIEDWKNCLIYKTIAENILTYRYPDLNELPPHVREQRLMFIDLLMKCVTIDPEKRISAAEALRHPFITSNLDNSD